MKFFIKSPAYVSVVLEDPAWPRKLQDLKERLVITPVQDPLWAGVIGVIDANIREVMGDLTPASLTTEEADRLRGRLGMLLDLKRELTVLHESARSMP